MTRKSGIQYYCMGLEGAKNMRWIGAVPAAERFRPSRSACGPAIPKSQVGVIEAWGGEIKIERAMESVPKNV